MRKDEINCLLKNGPLGAQAVEKIDNNVFLFKKEDLRSAGKCEVCSFYNKKTNLNSVWFELSRLRNLENGLWLYSEKGFHSFYNVNTNEFSEVIAFVELNKLGDGLWLLKKSGLSDNRCDNRLECFYNVKSNQFTEWFDSAENREDIGHGLFLFTKQNGSRRFYNVNNNLFSEWLLFEGYIVSDTGMVRCYSSFVTYCMLDTGKMTFGSFQAE